MQDSQEKDMDSRKDKILNDYCKQFPGTYKAIEKNIKMYNANCPKVSFSLEVREQ